MRAARQVLWLLMACALIAVSLVATPLAHAQRGYGPRADFGGTNGQLRAVLGVGDQVWVGGEFTEAFDGDHTISYPRTNVAVFNFNTGDVLPIALDTNGRIAALATDDERLVWFAGDFTEAAGEAVTHIAAFDVLTGQLDDTFSVVLDRPVNALHYRDGALYIGGEFTTVNGLSHFRLARVDPVTGAVDTSFRPDPFASVRSVDSFGDRVYAAGFFELVGSPPDRVARRWVSGFDSETGSAAGPEFPFLPLAADEANHKGGLRFVHVSPDGSYLYTGDNRNYLRKWDRTTGGLLWEREAEGDLQAVATEGNVVYGGTHDGLLEKGDERLLFTLDAATGDVDESFAPRVNSFEGIFAIELSQGALITGGDFTTIDGESSPHLAVFHGPSWSGATPLGAVPGDVGCDQLVSIGDAVLISQHLAGLRTVSTCPLSDPATQIGPGGDVNGDGVISIADAVLVAQCTAGLNNVLCPV